MRLHEMCPVQKVLVAIAIIALAASAYQGFQNRSATASAEKSIPAISQSAAPVGIKAMPAIDRSILIPDRHLWLTASSADENLAPRFLPAVVDKNGNVAISASPGNDAAFCAYDQLPPGLSFRTGGCAGLMHNGVLYVADQAKELPNRRVQLSGLHELQHPQNQPDDEVLIAYWRSK